MTTSVAVDPTSPVGLGVVRADGVRYDFDDDGRVVRIGASEADALRLEWATDRVVLDAGHRRITVALVDGLVRSVHGEGHDLEYHHDQQRRLVSVTSAATPTMPARVRGYRHDDVRIVGILRGDREMVTNGYDDRGRLVVQHDVTGARWRFEYDDDVTTMIDPLGRRWVDTYADGVLVAREDPDGHLLAIDRDRDGAVIGATLDGASVLGDVGRQPSHTVAAEHDALGRPTGLVGRLPFQISWGSDDRWSRIASPDGPGQVALERGAGNLAMTVGGEELLAATESAPGTWNVVRHDGARTELELDDFERPVRLVATDGTVTTWDWGHGLRLRRRVGPDGVSTFTQDAGGVLTGLSLADGRRISLERDGLDRVSASDLGGGRITFDRDAAGRIVTLGGAADVTIDRDDRGRPTEVRDAAGLTTWTWQDDSVVQTSPVGPTVMHAADGSSVLVDDTDVAACRPVRGAEVRADGVGGELVTALSEDGLALRADLIGGVQLSTQVTAFGRDRLLRWQQGDTVLREEILDRDRGGRLLGRSVDDVVETFAHDTADRLTAWTRPDTTVTWAWDDAGRLLRREGDTTRTLTHDDHGRVASVADGDSTRRVTHDASARRVTDGSWTFAYDAANFLVGATDGRVALTHTVDVTGLRVRTTSRVDGAVTQDVVWVWDRSFEVPRLAAAHDLVSGRREFVRRLGDGTAVAIIDPDVSSRSRLIVSDTVGTAMKVVALDGSRESVADLDPFGDGSVAGFDDDLITFGLAGGLADRRTGHVHFQARDYDPTTTAFLTPDPRQTPAGGVPRDPYSYCFGQPTDLVDRDGNWPNPFSAIGNAIGGVGDFVVDNLDTIGAVAGIVGAVLVVVGTGGTALPLVLGAVSVAASSVSMVENIQDGNTAGAILDGVSVVAGVVGLAGVTRLAGGALGVADDLAAEGVGLIQAGDEFISLGMSADEAASLVDDGFDLLAQAQDIRLAVQTADRLVGAAAAGVGGGFGVAHFLPDGTMCVP